MIWRLDMVAMTPQEILATFTDLRTRVAALEAHAGVSPRTGEAPPSEGVFDSAREPEAPPEQPTQPEESPQDGEPVLPEGP